MANVFVEESILQDWADFVRGKTGTSDKMKPAELLEKTKNEWASGGGSSDDVRYVTFMSDDGETKLFVKPVAVGDDCVDVIAKGLLETPTKEGSNGTTYHFVGWSFDIMSGTADEDVFLNVTEDRTLYAAYYAEMATTFSDASWDAISSAAEDGSAAQIFAVGDTKNVNWTLPNGNEITMPFRIVGFNHDDKADGNGKAGISVMSATAIDFENVLGFDVSGILTSTSKGWQNWDMRNYFSEILSLLPHELTQHIKPVFKLSNNGASTEIVTTTDSLWTPSVTELSSDEQLNTEYQALGQGATYAAFTDDASRIVFKHAADGTISETASAYLTRSMCTKKYSSNTLPQYITSKGANVTQSIATSRNFILGFCI